MNILIGCEYSAIVRTAFELKGHNAFSCDLLPSEVPGKHLQMPIESVLALSGKGDWDFIGLHLPCTAVALSGNRHYGRGKPLHQKREEAIDWTEYVIARAKWLAPKGYYENPANVMGPRIGKRTQDIQPYDFGQPGTKKNLALAVGTGSAAGYQKRF
jgi:hypothetical protein